MEVLQLFSLLLLITFHVYFVVFQSFNNSSLKATLDHPKTVKRAHPACAQT